MTHDERHAHDLLIDAVFAPLLAPAEVITVVARENDEGVVELTFGAEVIEEAADLLVEQGHGRVVATQPLALAGVAQLETGLVQE